MATIRIQTFIEAPTQVCFDMARDISVHEQTCEGSGERAVAGVTAGKISHGESVTFEGRHFGVRQRLTSKIVEFDPPRRFVDEMQEGAFKRLRHTHEFNEVDGGTLMVDIFDFQSPLGPLGWLADTLFLKAYMRRFVSKRNEILKRLIEKLVAEGGLEPPTPRV